MSNRFGRMMHSIRINYFTTHVTTFYGNAIKISKVILTDLPTISRSLKYETCNYLFL